MRGERGIGGLLVQLPADVLPRHLESSGGVVRVV